MTTHFAQSTTDKESETRKREAVHCKLYNPRSFNVQHIMNNAKMRKGADYLKAVEKRPPFSYLLDFLEPSVTITTVFGDVPLGSCLTHQLRDFGRPRTKFIFHHEIPQISSPKCKGFPDMPVLPESLQEFDRNIIPFHLLSFFEKEIIIQASEAYVLKKSTVLQGESELWLSEHTKRIIAPNFGTVLLRQQKRSEAMLKISFATRTSQM